ncbi:MAG: pyridoxamine 5'-phosphate oxidase family protein [Gammaproteobacteria bacterium]|nr:pyridoxamine 5'-phosphate oxidase family protein [Gammaproteobacteria bacterium]
MTAMTQGQKEAFLAGVHVGVLSIAREDQGPLAAPIWYGYVPGGDVWVMIGRNSRKAGLLALGTPVSLCAQRETSPYAYVTVEGPVVRIEEGTDQHIRELATRYLGSDEGSAYADNMPSGSRLTVTVRPETWLAVDYSRA